MATLSVLHAKDGDNKITISDDNPEKRREIAPKILEILKSCMVVLHRPDNKEDQISGYDAEKNEWILKADGEKVSAAGTEATVVAPKSGG